MTGSERIKILEAGIKSVVVPVLEQQGFVYDPQHRVFRRPEGECIQIIEFQVGVRAAEGTFCVNLGIYHPDYHHPAAEIPQPDRPREFHCLYEFRQRLGALRETWRTRLFKRLFNKTDNWLAWRLTTTSDKWWRFGSSEPITRRSLQEVVCLIEQYGLPWLTENSDPQSLQTCYEEIISGISRGN